MPPETLFLILFAAVILLGALGETLFARTQVPDVLWLIVAGILLGPVSGVVDPADLEAVAPAFAALTLIIVLFEGGSKLVLRDLVRSVPRAGLLAITSFLLTVAGVAATSMLAAAAGLFEEWSLAHGVMLGAIIGGSSSLIVMPSMALGEVEEEVANLVGIESGLTDALCVVVTLALVSIILSGEASTGGTLATLGGSFGIALGLGVLGGWAWMPVMRVLRGNPHAYPVTLSALVVLYVVIEWFGGSAALGILAFAVMIGNAPAILRKTGFRSDVEVRLDEAVTETHTTIAFIIKSMFFTFIGLMITPPWGLVAAGVALGALLLLFRLPAVWLATRGGGFDSAQRTMVAVSLPRGMAAGVLATLPAQQGVPGTAGLPSLVFAAVVMSIVLFAVGFPYARKKAAAREPAAMAEVGAEPAAEAAGAPGPRTPIQPEPVPLFDDDEPVAPVDA